jgi:uncharacterized protein
VTLDTSAILALLNRKDINHNRIRNAVLVQPPPYLVPTGILTEISYLVETRFGMQTMNAFINDICAGVFRLEHQTSDLERVQILTERYQNLPLGTADALVIACAERNDGLIISLDRHFWIVASEGKIRVQP